MFKLLRNIYIKLKKIPVLGNFLELIRSGIFHPKIHRIWLKYKDVKNARLTLQKIKGSKNSQILKYVKEFTKSPLAKQKFGHGYSGDYDVIILYCLVRLIKPKVIVETGVASGRSSAVILSALQKNNKGTLYSVDLPQYYEGNSPELYITDEGNNELTGFLPKGREPGWLVPDDLRDRWKLILGDSKIKLPKLLKSLDQIDLFYHDSDHSYDYMLFEFELAWPLIRKQGFLLSDDIHWNNAFGDFIKKISHDSVYVYRNFGIIHKK